MKLRKMRERDFASFTRRLTEAERRLALTPWDKFEVAAHDQTNAMRRVLSQETQQKLILFTKMLDQLEGSRRSIEDQIRAAREELSQVRTFVGELAQKSGPSFMKELMALKDRTFTRLKELEKDKQAMQANKEELEKVTGKKVEKEKILLLEFAFLDDLCSPSYDNTWTIKEINRRKEFLNPVRKKLQEQNIMLICLFEKNIILRSDLKKKNQYFLAM